MSLSRLLILDDDLEVGKTMCFVAETIGFEARCVSRPADFLQEVARWQPTHICLDLVMPEMDGLEVVRLLGERSCNAGIVISSGVGDRVLDAARRSAAASGLRILGTLPKPFAPAQLRALLSETAQAPRPARAVRTAPEPAISEAELRRGLLRQEFQLVYQPRVHCATGWLAGFEALVRWNRGGSVAMPAQFIGLAERCGLIDTLTEQVVEQALPWLAEQYGESAMTLSINLSASSLVSSDLGQYIARLCTRLGIDPRRIVFELTESGATGNVPGSLEQLTRLRMKGFELSIDDFGTGHSSLDRLAQLPFSELKADKSFVMQTTQSQEARRIVKSMVDLGHDLGLRVTAEGVEDRQTFEFLGSLGCDYAQGYFIARPMPGDQVQAWAANWNAGLLQARRAAPAQPGARAAW